MPYLKMAFKTKLTNLNKHAYIMDSINKHSYKVQQDKYAF